MEDSIEENESLTSLLNIRQKAEEEGECEVGGEDKGAEEGKEKMGDEEEREMRSGEGDKAEAVIGMHEEKGRKEDERESDGGILSNLISSMPVSLPVAADAAPATDEASLLISIIHD